MAPTKDDIASIKDLISQLQTRVEQMERNLQGGSARAAESLRIILMGPPGAGELLLSADTATVSLDNR